jgi:hypothetical protein
MPPLWEYFSRLRRQADEPGAGEDEQIGGGGAKRHLLESERFLALLGEPELARAA